MATQDGKDIGKAAELILQAWNDESKALTDLPETLRPANLAQAYAVQHAVSEGLGAIGGWIVWESDLTSGLACTPIPLACIHPSPEHLLGNRWVYRHLIPGIGFRIGLSLPDYDAPFSRERILAAIASRHAVIGVRQPRIAGTAGLDALTALADSEGYACLVYCHRGTPWRDAGLVRSEVRFAMAGKEIAARSMVAGVDIIETMRWLAGEGSRWAGGLMVGQLVMIGTETGAVEVPQDASATASIGDLGSVEIRFVSDAKRAAPPAPYPRIPRPSWLKRLIRDGNQ